MKKKITITESDIRKIVKTVCTRLLNEGVNTNNVLNKIYIQYGADEYDPELFRKVDDSVTWLNKPLGGLWGSSLDSKNGSHWGDWCDGEQFRGDTFDKHFLFKLSPDAKIYVINNLEDLKNASTRVNKTTGKFGLDIHWLVENYDGIYVTKKAAWDFHIMWDSPIEGLDTWDVESICIFNPNVVIPVKEDSFDKAKVRDYSSPNPWEEDVVGFSGKDERQMKHDFNLYGNKNVEKDMSKFFNGKHPAITAQGDGRTRDVQKARNFNGTIKSGIKEDRTLYHGTRADFNQFDLAYLSSGWGQQDWGYGVYLTDYPDCAKEYGRGGMIYTVQVPQGKYLNDQRITPTEANNIARNFFNYYLNTDYGKEAYANSQNDFWEYECSYIGKSTDGLNLYGSISQILGSDEEASRYLDSIGYVGLKYRGENRDNGKKFWNYVIFDPSKIKIVNKQQI